MVTQYERQTRKIYAEREISGFQNTADKKIEWPVQSYKIDRYHSKERARLYLFGSLVSGVKKQVARKKERLAKGCR